ncbi:hypothetical protein H5T51_00745 [Candidatus Bathyarchaeota archaeon]|nr:hypothetical protein [Candidatus Bathyarchaeota archaeon]
MSGDEVDHRLSKAIVVLLRNTTWRCGKLERLIVEHLHKEAFNLGKYGTPLREMLQKFGLKGKRRNEFIDAIKRLERRNIIRVLNL